MIRSSPENLIDICNGSFVLVEKYSNGDVSDSQAVTVDDFNIHDYENASFTTQTLYTLHTLVNTSAFTWTVEMKSFLMLYFIQLVMALVRLVAVYTLVLKTQGYLTRRLLATRHRSFAAAADYSLLFFILLIKLCFMSFRTSPKH
ncbi:unnamed protein product [Adineta ricciae]|uniref:Uncharacterized protein n=1 Tax=Adineta ricciae TaxID=249248 RepID=A0A816AR17_ADIRI|nr:unnamed protein product [Adineta ricciae]